MGILLAKSAIVQSINQSKSHINFHEPQSMEKKCSMR